MIQIYPSIDPCLTYLYCSYSIKKIVFSGMRVLAEADTDKYGEIIGDVPISQATNSPFFYIRNTDTILPPVNNHWFGKLFEKTVQSISKNITCPLTLKHNIKNDQLILINCIDTYYGHSLLKLLNVSWCKNHYPESDILVIIPQFMSWLVPIGINCLLADIKLRESYAYIQNLNSLIEPLFKEYNKVYLDNAANTPNPLYYSLSDYTKLSSADPLKNLTSKEPLITFIWREDRTIYADTIIEKLSDYLSNRLNFKLINRILVWRQIRFIKRLYQRIKLEIPYSTFSVIGLGQSFHLPKGIRDLRKIKPDEETEKIWCSIYSSSSVVVGVHGSNMLLPSGLAASTIELLPKDRIDNFLQDILIPKTNDPKDILYRYRFLPVGVTADLLSKTIVSLINKYSLLIEQQLITNRPNVNSKSNKQ